MAGLAVKVKTFRPEMTISSPVWGLRPLRRCLVRTAKFPKFLILTFSPRSKEALITSNVACTTLKISGLEILFFSEIRDNLSLG